MKHIFVSLSLLLFSIHVDIKLNNRFVTKINTNYKKKNLLKNNKIVLTNLKTHVHLSLVFVQSCFLFFRILTRLVQISHILITLLSFADRVSELYVDNPGEIERLSVRVNLSLPKLSCKGKTVLPS